MNRLFRIMLVLSLCILPVTLSGCGFKDLDKRFFALSIGIDKGSPQTGKKFKVTVKLAIPDPQIKMGAEKFQIFVQNADSVSEAVRMTKTRIDKELDFGHCKALILGQDLVKEDIHDAMDWLIRRRDIQMIAWVAVGKPDAETVLKTQPKSERLPSNAIFLSFGDTGVESAYTITAYLFDFYTRMRENGLDAVLPVITAEKDYFKINQAVLFDKSKARLTLSPDETKTLNILMNGYDKVDVKAKEDGIPFYVATENVKRRYSIHTPPGKQPYVDLRIREQGIVEESFQPVAGKQLPDFGQAIAKASRQRIEGLLAKLQKHRLDPIGFGLHYRSRHWGDTAAEWQEWQQIYPRLEFRVQVKYHLSGTGEVF